MEKLEVDRSRILDYIFEENPNPFLKAVSRLLHIQPFTRRRYKKDVSITATDRFIRVPLLPTLFDRAIEHQSRESRVDYYRDVRDISVASKVGDDIEERQQNNARRDISNTV